MSVYEKSRTNQPDDENKKKRIRIAFIRTLCIVLALAIPILFYSVIKDTRRQARSSPLSELKMSPYFQKAELDKLIEQMKFNKEFQLYFYVYNAADIMTASQKTYDILKSYPTAESLLSCIQTMQKQVEAQAVILRYIKLGEQFIKDPQSNPKLKVLIEDFFSDAFVLTITGLFYKINFDENFSFEWSLGTLQVAENVKDILLRWKNVN